MADEVEAGDGERLAVGFRLGVVVGLGGDEGVGERLAEGVAKKADGEASVLRPNRSGEPFLAN